MKLSLAASPHVGATGQCQPAMAALGRVLHPWGTSIPAAAGLVPAPARLSPLLQSPEPAGEAAEGTCAAPGAAARPRRRGGESLSVDGQMDFAPGAHGLLEDWGVFRGLESSPLEEQLWPPAPPGTGGSGVCPAGSRLPVPPPVPGAEGPTQGRRPGRRSVVLGPRVFWCWGVPWHREAGLGLVTGGSWTEATRMCLPSCCGTVAIDVCACTALPQAAASVRGTY